MLMEVGLTVGNVSGLIAAGVFLLQIFIPTAVCVVLVGLLSEEHSAVSWSVISRILHSSYWPVFLRGDSASSKGVCRRVKFIAFLQPITLIILAITAIVTPLGLYDELTPSDQPVSIQFQHAPDLSPFARATTPRGGPEPLEQHEHWLSWRSPRYVRIKPVRAIYPFDIEWRTFEASHKRYETVDENHTYSKGFYRQYTNFIPDETLRVVDGLIVDEAERGRIGFRNHTVPTNAISGATWSEDILFIEPEVQCVDSNLTVDYVYLGRDHVDNFGDTVLVDHGGFSNLSPDKPDAIFGDYQEDPSLYERAYTSAWYQAAKVMQVSNITDKSQGRLNSYTGKQFDATHYDTYMYLSHQTIGVEPNYLFLAKALGARGPANKLGLSFIDLQDRACGRPHYGQNANMSAPGVYCAVFLGAARRIGGDDTLRDINSTWRVPIHSCAAATRATVSRVFFRFNGTDGLNSLHVDDIRGIPYKTDDDMPLWGVESLDNFTIAQALPLWGIVSREVADRDDVTAIQREHLWLPSDMFSHLGFGMSDLPGNRFYQTILSNLFAIDGLSSTVSAYTGASNVALYQKWKELSFNTTGTEKILRLIWTDIAANYVVGAKGRLSTSKLIEKIVDSNSSKQSTVDVPVTLNSRAVKYHIAYIIPAVVILFFALLIGLATFCLLASRRTSVGKTRRYLMQTSTGRILGKMFYLDDGNPLDPTDTWIRSVGKRPIRLTGSDGMSSHQGVFEEGHRYRQVRVSAERKSD